MKKKKCRKLLGQGFPWFGRYGDTKYRTVTLFSERHGYGKAVEIRFGRLGAWRRVKLYAEWEEVQGR